MSKLLERRLWVDLYQEGKDDISIVKEGCRLRHKGVITTEKKKNPAERMKRVAEAVEGVKRSNAVHQNKGWNDK